MDGITPFDVACFILRKLGETSAMKLQKLLYYAQAWSLVWEEKELFDEDFQAWANGPVLPSVYQAHKGKFKVSAADFAGGNPDKLSKDQAETVDSILEFYGKHPAQWLSNLTHQEDPWKNARGDTPTMAPSTAVISKASMEEYYSSL